MHYSNARADTIRIGRHRLTNGRDLLAPAHSAAQVARDLRLPAHMGTTRRRSGGRPVGHLLPCSVRPSSRVVRQRPAFRRQGPFPSSSSSSSLARSIAYYLLTYFLLLPIFLLRRCEESQPAATSKRGGFDLQSVGYTMSGGCCCCCGGPI